MPKWIEQGFAEYAKRLPKTYQLELIEISAKKRNKSISLQRIRQEESLDLLNKIPSDTIIIALDEHGKEWSTLELSQQLQKWHDAGQDIAILIGGADGLSQEILQKAHKVWSLSKLTFPHAVVRVIVAEQLYRAWSIIQNHPYHRGMGSGL